MSYFVERPERVVERVKVRRPMRCERRRSKPTGELVIVCAATAKARSKGKRPGTRVKPQFTG